MTKDPYRYFRQEALELLEQLNQGLLGLEKEYAAETVAALLRHAHTLKGAARVVKQTTMAEQVHSLEDVLENFRHAQPEQPNSLINQALRWLDRITLTLSQLSQPSQVKAPSTRVMKAEESSPLALDPNEIQSLLADITQAYTRLNELKGGLSAWQEVAELASHQLWDEIEPIAQREERELAAQLENLRGQLRDVHHSIEELRLRPLSSLFTILQRSLRDAAQELNLQAEFVARGSEVKLEESTLRLLRAALVQAVRNSVAHGLESPEERRRAGKNPMGRVTLEVERRGTWVKLSFSDDGRGIDTAALSAAAGASSSGALDQLLEGGHSTSQKVSQMAGRGVGMDVIREAAQRLGGEITLESQPGQGFWLHLKFPVRAASLAALRVRSRGRSLLLPLESVLKVSREETAEFRDLACASLGDYLHWGPSEQTEDVRILVSVAAGMAVLKVEAVDGMVQALVQPLPRLAPAHPALAGAALDLDGRPELVLDPSRITQLLTTPASSPATKPRAARVLVVDDSLTTRVMEQSILEAHGYLVDLACSGMEALSKVELESFDFFLIDAEMPGMSGFELIAQLRQRESEKDTPILMVSSLPRAQYESAAHQAGANGYVEKSRFDQEELLGEIRRLLS